MLFFGATVGRSGSTWLARLLNRSATHVCRHEVADGRDPAFIHGWRPFPVQRFLRNGPNYGEVHGFLRYHLSAGHAGLERLIPRRFLLTREPRAVIRSWMNRDGRTMAELGAVIFEVTTQQRLLAEWAASDEGARVFALETLTRDLSALRELSAWLEIGYEPVEADMRTRVNANADRRKGEVEWFEWNDAAEDLFQRTVKRQSSATKAFWRAGPDGPGALTGGNSS